MLAIATSIEPTKADSVLRRQKDGTRIEFSSPESVSLYNKYMGGVDLNDQRSRFFCHPASLTRTLVHTIIKITEELLTSYYC